MLSVIKSFVLKGVRLVVAKAYVYKLTFQYRNVINKKVKNKSKRIDKKEITEIKMFYSNYGYKNIKTTWHDFYYSNNNRYSVEYVPEDLFHSKISKNLNQMRQWPALLDKNLLGQLFKEFKQPEDILKNINGFYYVGNLIVSKNDAVKYIKNENCTMVIKPSIDSGDGQAVVSFSLNDKRSTSDDLRIIYLLDKYNKNYIIQRVVNQHETLKNLNPSSLNTVRILSYLNENGVHVLSTIVRVGKEGSFTDNCATGGIACGVNVQGKLKKQGYLNDGTLRRKTDNGVILEDIEVPSYNLILNQVKQMHLLIPYFRLVSWDIGVDDKNTPILIEYNTYHQDITIHQLANGPLFGSFFDEILTQGSN